MLNLKLNLKYSGIEQKSIMQYKEKVEQIHQDLHSRANDQKDFVGWLNLPTNYDKEEFERIKKSAQKIQKDSYKVCLAAFGAGLSLASAICNLGKLDFCEFIEHPGNGLDHFIDN